MRALLLSLLVALGVTAQDRIIFEQRDTMGNFRSMLMRKDGFHHRPLLLSSPQREISPRISPDGRRLAYSTDADVALGYHIFVRDLLFGGRTQLTFESGVEHNPDWSPDGSKIIYSRCDPSLTNCDLMLMNADGSQQTPVCSSAQDDDWARFSPDLLQVTFMSNRAGNYEIYRCDLTNGAATRLTNNPAVDGWPVWTPDGQSIVFSSRRDVSAAHELYVMSAIGNNVTRLTNNTVNDYQADLSTDGTRVAWSRGLGTNTYEIFEAALSVMGSARQLTSNSLDDLFPQYGFVTRKVGRAR
jgi:Tol biopolymer transport system component